jgi:hypothetical protein
MGYKWNENIIKKTDLKIKTRFFNTGQNVVISKGTDEAETISKSCC